jgi:hypothetical protein
MVTHRKSPDTPHNQTRTVCGAPLRVFEDHWICLDAADKWAHTTCPDCLAKKPEVGLKAAKGRARTHFGGTSALHACGGFTSITLGAACGAAVYACACSMDLADVTCGSCQRTAAFKDALFSAKHEEASR